MAKLVNFADLSMIAVPERTETYIPVSHQELVTRVKKEDNKIMVCHRQDKNVLKNL